MIIIAKRSPNILSWANDAARHTTQGAQHLRCMQWFNSLNAVDLETAKMYMGVGPKSWEHIAIWPLPVATAINAIHPEVFNDRTGRAMVRFLQSDDGRPYRVPGSKL